MTNTVFSEDVRQLIEQARRGFEAGSDIAWLTASQAAIGHRLDGGRIEDNPFDPAQEERLHEAWTRYFGATKERRREHGAAPRYMGSTQAPMWRRRWRTEWNF